MALVRQIAFFGLVGILATFIHVALALSLITYTEINPYLANALGALSALGVSFFGNSHLTFLYRGSVSRAFLKFLAQSGISFALTNIILFGVEKSGWPEWSYAAIVVAIVPPTSFLFAKLWVFRSEGH